MRTVTPNKTWYCTKTGKMYHYLGITKHRKTCGGKHIKTNEMSNTKEGRRGTIE